MTPLQDPVGESGRQEADTGPSAKELLRLHDFDGFIRSHMSEGHPRAVWEIQYSEPWMRNLGVRTRPSPNVRGPNRKRILFADIKPLPYVLP